VKREELNVELRGFEPLTPSMRTRCATGLRHSPWNAVSVANTGTPRLPAIATAIQRRAAQLATARLAVSSASRTLTAGHSAAVIEYRAESLGWRSLASR
jgi:hypothetical protein